MKTMIVRPKAQVTSLVLAVVFLFSGVTGISAQENVNSASRFFPASTAIFMEIADPPQLIDAVMEHRLRTQIEEIDQVQQFLKSPQYAMAMMGKELLEKQLGCSWDTALRNVTSEGLYLGFDAKTQGIALMFKSNDEAALKKTAETFLNMASMAAQREGGGVPYQLTQFGDCKVADFGEFLIARQGTWFLVSNNKKLAKQISNNLNRSSEDNVASQSWYQEVAESQSGEPVWLAMNLEVIRDAGVAKELFAGSVDDPGAELLLGGVLDGLKNAAHVSANLRLDDSLQVNLALPFKKEWASATREFFYGPSLEGRAPKLVDVKNSIASLTTYRDFGSWWLAKEDLFSEGVIAQMAEFDSQISTLLAGLDFGEEFLGGLESGLQVVVVEHQSEKGYEPDVKLPGFAVVAELKDEAFARKVRVAYKNMIGIFNLNLGMAGQTQLDTTTEKLDGISLTSAEYLFEDDAEEGLLLYNFSPSIAFVGRHAVLASTRGLALDVAEQLKAGSFHEATASNTRLEMDAQQLLHILKLNKEALVANNMVAEGNSRSDAEEQIDGLLLIAGLFKAATMDFQVQDDQMSLSLELEFKE